MKYKFTLPKIRRKAVELNLCNLNLWAMIIATTMSWRDTHNKIIANMCVNIQTKLNWIATWNQTNLIQTNNKALETIIVQTKNKVKDKHFSKIAPIINLARISNSYKSRRECRNQSFMIIMIAMAMIK